MKTPPAGRDQSGLNVLIAFTLQLLLQLLLLMLLLLLLLAAGVAISTRGAFSTRVEPVPPRASGRCAISTRRISLPAQYCILLLLFITLLPHFKTTLDDSCLCPAPESWAPISRAHSLRGFDSLRSRTLGNSLVFAKIFIALTSPIGDGPKYFLALRASFFLAKLFMEWAPSRRVDV